MKLIWNSAANFYSLGKMIYAEIPVRHSGISSLRLPLNSIEAIAITKILTGTESVSTISTQELFALKRIRLLVKPDELARERPAWTKPLDPLSFVSRETFGNGAILFKSCISPKDRVSLFRYFSETVIAGQARRNVALAAPKQYLTNPDFLSPWSVQSASAISIITGRHLREMGTDWVQSYPPKEPERIDPSQPSEVYLRRDYVLMVCLHVDPTATEWPLYLGEQSVVVQPGDALFFSPSRKNHRKPLPQNGLANTLNFYFQESPK